MPTDATDTALRLTDVIFTWPGQSRFSLSLPSFSVTRGERLLLRGPSGSGKTTLLSLVCGIVQPDSGSVEVIGTDIAKLSGSARDRFRADHIGVIFQMFNLLPYGSVLDNVLLPLSFSAARRARATQDGNAEGEATRLLEHLELGEDLLTQPASALSVGQQQRVAVARALIGRPEIVIADEPTSALDRDRREAFLRLLMNEVGAAGATLLMVSHDDSLADCFDRVMPYDAIAESRKATA